MLFTSLPVQAVILAMSAKLPDTSRHAFTNTYTGTGPHISLSTFNNPRHAVIPALLNVLKVMDPTTTKFQVKIKEASHISWEQPSLNKQLYHVNLTLSF